MEKDKVKRAYQKASKIWLIVLVLIAVIALARVALGDRNSRLGGTGQCNDNYSGYCVPNVSYDINCGDIRHRVQVVGRDVYHFDADGDGVGCESY